MQKLILFISDNNDVSAKATTKYLIELDIIENKEINDLFMPAPAEIASNLADIYI